MFKGFYEFENIENLLRDFTRFNYSDSSTKEVKNPDVWIPLADIYEDSKSFKFKIDLPGIEKENVKVTFTENKLRVIGIRFPEKEEEHCAYHHIERPYGKFIKEFDIPENVLKDEINAKFDKGQLIITLPKSEESYKDNSIEIKIK